MADHAAERRLSLGVITALMPLALFGVLGLAAVVLVHDVAEIVMIANGVRAGRALPLITPVQVCPPIARLAGARP